ncbi:hypothetical protein ABPG72_012259 [Tetrahymena utriculariae]
MSFENQSTENNTNQSKKQLDLYNIQIDEMEIMRTIGKGKTCTVKTAKMPNSDKIFAIKQFKSYASAVQDLNNEITSLQTLSHENIIEMVSFDKKNVVLEYLANGELFDVVAKQKFSERVAKFYFRQLINAIQYIHENGFAHRDIKLENILISNEFNLKLADFGFATKITEGQKFERIMGTEGYMAPELQARQRYCGKKVDIFACGVVLFSIVNGMPPFFKATQNDPYYRFFVDNNYDAYWANLAKKYNNNISDEFKDLINKMLAYNEEDRISASEILNHSWLQEESACTYEEASNFVRDIISSNN